MDELIASLKKALDAEPRNGPLWLHYAELLVQAGRRPDAVLALRSAVELLDDKRAASLRLVGLLREQGELAEALIRAEKLLDEQATPDAHLELGRILVARGDAESAAPHLELARLQFPDEVAGLSDAAATRSAPADRTGGPEEKAAAQVGGDQKEDDWASQFDWEDLAMSFDDVVGLDDVKRQIRLRIIAPFENPEIYRAFRRQGGGGLLLYGPPGCGKTLIARATAGECGARFVNVSIHEIVDQYWGQSEKMVHALFEDARRKTPTVLFFDEFDALGSGRGRGDSKFWNVLVNQLLQEMDGLKGRNDDVLVFAATNMPWNVDTAFRRPGRFDRVLFVPPPDQAARAEILRVHTEKLPGGGSLKLKSLAKATALFTGADLRSLAERAAERALESSLGSGAVVEVHQGDFEREFSRMQPSSTEWLATARNYARYANEGGQYDDLAGFLRSVKKW